MTPDELKRSRSAFPVAFTHDEEGSPLTEATHIQTEPVSEAEEEEVVLELDRELPPTRGVSAPSSQSARLFRSLHSSRPEV